MMRITFFFFVLIMTIGMMNSYGQSRKHTHSQFTYLINDSFADTVLNGEQVYMENTIFLDLDEVNNYDNAYKYLDALESRLQSGYETKRGVGMLGGVPVLKLFTVKSGENAFTQDYYIWDNGKTVFSLTISGFARDWSIVEKRFKVTKDSFIFQTERHMIGACYMAIPKIMGIDGSMVWSRVHRTDTWLEEAFYFKKYEEESVEKSVNDLKKNWKKEKYREISESTYTVNGIQVVRLKGTYDYKLKNSVEERTTIIFYLSNAPVGYTTLFVRTVPEVSPFLLQTMENMVSTVSLSLWSVPSD